MKKKFVKILTPVFLLVIIVSLSFPCSAADYQFSFRELMSAGGVSIDLTGYDGTYTVSNGWNWADFMTVTPKSTASVYKADIISNDNSLFQIDTANSILMCKIPTFVLASSGFSYGVNDEYALKFEFRFLKSDGTFKYVSSPVYNASSTGADESSFHRPYAYFTGVDFEIQVPANSTRLYSISVIASFPVTSNAILVGTWGGKFTFYVGPRSEAPLYTTPSISNQDSFEASEDALLGATGQGFDSALDTFASVSDFFNGSNAIYRGAFFLSSFLTDVMAELPWLEQMVMISLVIGIFGFVLAGISFITSNSKAPERFSHSKGGRRSDSGYDFAFFDKGGKK